MASQRSSNSSSDPQDINDMMYDSYTHNQSQQRHAPHAHDHNVTPSNGYPHPSHSPTSLQKYALFPPAPLPSVTPGPGMPYQPNSVGTNSFPSSSQQHQQHLSHHSSGSDTPEPQTSGNRKPNACQLCNASFERRFDLKRHMHTHSDQKEFICPRCDKALARSDSLNRHQAVCKGPRTVAP